jgi:VWFA-related protein
LVQLTLSVTDREGRPVLGLNAADFAVIEDGKPQRISNVLSEEAPFNLVLLLDCSSTTEGSRPAISEAARRFVGVARHNDRVAVHAFAHTRFLVLSRLTTGHEAAKDSLDVIDALAGGTPLYDSIVLSYADEISRLRQQRNAIVVLTDGLDNSIYSAGLPSVISFSELEKAAAEMDALIYPVILDPLRSFRSKPELHAKALKWKSLVVYRAEELAKTTGGRVFYASSIQDLEPVYEQVAAELRSVYTLSYSPSNQTFDGQWRRVRSRVKGARVTARTRPGYYAY